MRTGRAFPLLLALLAATTPAQRTEGIGDEALTAAVASMRGGEWTADSVTTVVQGLIERDRLAAAGFWLTEAEDAIERKALARKAKPSVVKLRKTWTAALPQGARRIGRDLVSVADSLLRAKAYESARKQLDRAAAALALWPDRSSTRKLEFLEKKARGGSDVGARVSSKLHDRRGAVRSAWKKISEAWLADGLADYEAFGTPAAYRQLARLMRVHDRKDDLAKLRKLSVVAGLADGLKRTAKLWVMAPMDVEVYVDGNRIGVQPGVVTMIMSQFGGGPLGRPKRLDFDLWAGSRLVLVTKTPKGLDRLPRALGAPRFISAICARLERDGKVLRGWRTTNGESVEAADHGALRSAVMGTVGPLRGASEESFGERKKATKSVTFKDRLNEGGLPASQELCIPVSPRIEEFFEAEKIEGTWWCGFEEHPIYVLDADV